MRRLIVHINHRLIGELQEGGDIWRFSYDADWINAADSFDLAPGLPRNKPQHLDGGTNRPVQWYFDNLLPEEMLRQAISREAGIKGEDAFALLAYLGAESAGSLTLLPAGDRPPDNRAMQKLADAQLSARIAALPRQTLAARAPKRMSLAGAQHKLLVILQNNELYEPVGATASSHILKPNHPFADIYPASVINEYMTMRLARAAGLAAPQVHLRYVPQPVYIIDRFDRRIAAATVSDDGPRKADTERVHIIDACQLLNRARTFKYSGASLGAMADIINATTNRAHTRLALYRWLVFNVLLGNDDAHLKNLSFYISPEGIRLAPHYDMLATAAYSTRAVVNENATWPDVGMAIELPGARRFGEVTAASMLAAGGELGLPASTSKRILREVIQKVMAALPVEFEAIAKRHETLAEDARAYIAGEQRLLRILQSVIIQEMSDRLSS